MAKLNPLVKIRLRNVLALALNKPILCFVQDIDQLLERRPELAKLQASNHTCLRSLALLFSFRQPGSSLAGTEEAPLIANTSRVNSSRDSRVPVPSTLYWQKSLDLISPATCTEPLPALSLPSMVGFTTAFVNDDRPEYAFAQQVVAFGKPSDLLLAISTSGNSQTPSSLREPPRRWVLGRSA